MKKITLLLILGIILSFSMVSAYPILKTYDKNYNFVVMQEGGITYFNEVEATVTIFVELGSLNPTNFKICHASNGCGGANTFYNTDITTKNFTFTINAPTSLYSFKVYLDDIAVGNNRILLKAVGTSCTKEICSDACTSSGLMLHQVPYVCTNLGSTCAANSILITDDPTCVPVGSGGSSSRPSIKSVEGITVTRSFERSITAKAKIFQIACEGSGTMIVDMDGYTSYDVYHLGRYVETSTEAEYEINTCSEWIFDPTGYIAECRGTKTTVFAAMGLISMMTLIFIGFSMVKIFNGGDYSIEVIYTLIGFSLAVIIGILVLGQMSGMICGV